MSENNFNIKAASSDELTQAFAAQKITLDELMAETARRATVKAQEEAAKQIAAAAAAANPELKAWEQWAHNHQPVQRVYCAAKNCKGHNAEDFELHSSRVTKTSWSMDESGNLSTINLFDAGSDVRRNRLANHVSTLAEKFFCQGGVLKTYPWTKGGKSAVTIRFVEKAKGESEDGAEDNEPKNSGGSPQRGRDIQR